jgi:hypothetical protein
VLSLSDSTGAKNVQLMVEGKPLKSGSFDFSKPVSRSVHINPIQY